MPDPTFQIDGILGTSGLYGFYRPDDPAVHGWLLEAREEGEQINRADPAYSSIDQWMAYVEGEQQVDPTPGDVPTAILNFTKRVCRAHISALTDLKPIFEWKTENPAFRPQSKLINDLIHIWYANVSADMAIGDVDRFAIVAGSGDCVVDFDKYFCGGDTRLSARAPRDTLPLRPSRTSSLQDWEGVTIREGHSPNKLKALFSDRAGLIVADSGRFPASFTRFAKRSLTQTRVSTLSGLGRNDPNRKTSAVTVTPEVTLYRTFLKDRSLNLSDKSLPMGKPGTNWFYVVPPGEPLYPRGRMLLWVEGGVLYDGPNPYWHGLFPLGRLRLDPWPWSFLGLPLIHDMKGMQDSINRVVSYLLQILSQHVNRGQIWDTNMPPNMKKMFDARMPNWKVTKPNAFSDGMKLAEVPNVPPWAMPFLEMLFRKFNELTGVAGLEAFLQLRQAPGAETVQKFMEALTPEIRLEGRQVEFFLRDIAGMVKTNIFQFQTSSKRFAILGSASRTVESLDYDPETLVPALASDDPNYVPELDASLPRHERARFFTNQFSFFVTANSMLALHAQERKMLYLQLARMGYMDIWTLGEMLEIPNMGAPPAVPLPDPANPMIQVPRVPETIPERLAAQQLMGIGAVVSPAGRKSSGQQPPHAEQKGDGRAVVSESP